MLIIKINNAQALHSIAPPAFFKIFRLKYAFYSHLLPVKRILYFWIAYGNIDKIQA